MRWTQPLAWRVWEQPLGAAIAARGQAVAGGPCRWVQACEHTGAGAANLS